MKELDYITKKIEDEFETDETITDTDKVFIKGKILAAKYRIEEEMLEYKRYSCHDCIESLCPKKEPHVLHCMVR